MRLTTETINSFFVEWYTNMRSLETVDRSTRSAMQDEKDQSILDCWQEVQLYFLSTRPLAKVFDN